MDVHASLRSLRMSPRKVRLVIDAVRGLRVEQALIRLQFMEKAAARPVLKLLQSAIANADHNFHIAKDTLFVKTITADGGTTLKRSRPRAFGRGAPIKKRTTHINLILADVSEKKIKKETARVIKTVNQKKTVKAKEATSLPSPVISQSSAN